MIFASVCISFLLKKTK